MTNIQIISDLISSYPVSGKTWVHHETKPHGGYRKIISPNRQLNSWLKKANTQLYKLCLPWPDIMHGGIKKRSYVTFAQPHVGKQHVITVDIRKCFDNIRDYKVAEVLAAELQISEDVAAILAKLLCYKRVLPQGYATSNLICNLVLRERMNKINLDLSSMGYTVTNYVDDIAISGNIENPHEVINSVATELSRCGLAINKLKVKVYPANKPQTICGLTVNKKLAISRGKRLQLCRAVATGSISDESLQGWLANLHSVNPEFESKLRAYAQKSGYIL